MRLLTLATISLVSIPSAQQDARLRTVEVRDNLYMLMGRGGNVGLSIGERPFIIDDQFAPSVGQIRAAVHKLVEKPVEFVINTHHHGDHTGGNERFGKAGAVIVAHANVRKRMSTTQFSKSLNRTTPASPKDALPVVTFDRDVNLHLNGDDVRVFHVPHAHTDGDVVVWFKQDNVFHMGDVFNRSGYPFVDIDGGGSFKGIIAAADRVLELSDDETKIMPGHGELSDKAGLQEYRTVLATIHERLTKLIVAGKTVDEVVAAKPCKEWDATWGNGFMKPEQFLRIIYQSITDERKPSAPRRRR